MKWLGRAVPWVFVVLLATSPVAADSKISCEKSFLEFADATDQVTCYRYKDYKFTHDYLIDETNTDWIGIGLQKAGHRARLTNFVNAEEALGLLMRKKRWNFSFPAIVSQRSIGQRSWQLGPIMEELNTKPFRPIIKAALHL